MSWQIKTTDNADNNCWQASKFKSEIGRWQTRQAASLLDNKIWIVFSAIFSLYMQSKSNHRIHSSPIYPQTYAFNEVIITSHIYNVVVQQF